MVQLLSWVRKGMFLVYTGWPKNTRGYLSHRTPCTWSSSVYLRMLMYLWLYCICITNIESAFRASGWCLVQLVPPCALSTTRFLPESDFHETSPHVYQLWFYTKSLACNWFFHIFCLKSYVHIKRIKVNKFTQYDLDNNWRGGDLTIYFFFKMTIL